MSENVFKAGIWQEVLKGTRQWKAADGTSAALDSFDAHVVTPLRELEVDGLLKIRAEHTGSYQGRRCVDMITVALEDEA